MPPHRDEMFGNDNPTATGYKLKQFQFNDGVISRIRQLHRMDNYHGIIECAQDWLVIFAAVVVSQWSISHASLMLSTPIYLAAIFVIGTRMRALAELLHQSAHGSLVKQRWLNKFLGTVVTGWPVLQSWTGYHQSHVVEHHQFLGDPARDPDFQALIKAGLYHPNTTRAEVVAYLWSIPSPKNTVAYTRYLLTNRIMSPSETPKETAARVVFYALVVFGFWYQGQASIFILYWLVPLLTTANWVGAFIELFEHYPLLTRALDVDIYKSRNRICNAFEDFFLGIHNEGYHLVHHLWSRLPAWNLKEAHRVMMSEPEYRKIHENRPNGWAAIIREVLGYF